MSWYQQVLIQKHRHSDHFNNMEIIFIRTNNFSDSKVFSVTSVTSVMGRALTVAALAAQPFLETCCPIHARLVARGRDLVGVGLGADGQEGNKAIKVNYKKSTI